MFALACYRTRKSLPSVQLQADGHRVLVVGDGVNDAPAMAAADTSVAMGRIGADLTLDTADVVTIRDELSTIPTVISLARRARRVVMANLAIAASFITALVVWDLFGSCRCLWVSPATKVHDPGRAQRPSPTGLPRLARRRLIQSLTP